MIGSSLFALAWLLAEGEGQGQGGGNPLGLLIPMAFIFFLMWLLIIRPANRREKDRQAQLLATLEKNDKVITTAGIYGTVVSVSSTEDEVVVRVDDNTRLKMLKGSIARNLTKEEAAQKKPGAPSDAVTTDRAEAKAPSQAITAEKKAKK